MNDTIKSQPGDQASPTPPDVDYVALKPGQTIGRYEILAVLGQGGFGITYRARDVQLDREVAIKEYLPSALAVRQDSATVLPRSTKMADDFGWGRDRFVTEGRTLASLHRVPAIVHVFDFLEANGTAYIVMELLSGETLEDRISRNGRLTPEEVDRILWPLLDGLEQVHSAGFLHRDIKPANILLDANGNPTLIDFGASRAAMVGRTAAMTAIFTPGYAAAEQMTSAKQGPWSDIYGLAATIYHAITGKTPPNAFDRMLDDTYEPLTKVAPAGFAPGLLAGVDAGLAVAARDRPQSIAGWRPILGMTSAPEAGATVVMGKESAAPTTVSRVSVLGAPTVVERPATAPSEEPKKKTGLWIAIAAVVLLALGGGGYYAMATRGPDPEMVKAKAAAESAEAERRKAQEEAEKLRAERAEQQAKAKAEQDAKDRTEAQRKIEEDALRKAEAAFVEKKRLEDEARQKAEADEAARKKAAEDARKAAEFAAGNFDHFGKTLNLIVLKDRPGEIRLQGADSVDDPDIHKLAVNSLAEQTRNLRCRQTDRLTDGTPLYRCLITKRTAKEPLADAPDSDRDDVALTFIKTGLLLASCDAPRSYSEAEDDARARKLYLWGRVNIAEYKRRCAR